MEPALRGALCALILLPLLACSNFRLPDPADHTEIARIVDHDRETTQPGAASSSLRSGNVLPGDSDRRARGVGY
jgi:hypothetical protein